MVIALDLKGLAVSTGAACSSGAIEPSHVLMAMGLQSGSGACQHTLQPGQAEYCGRHRPRLALVPETVARLRELSPEYRKQAVRSLDMPSPKTIAVAMSGGVDSSTVAAMLRAEGHNVIGLTMQLWNQRRLAGHARDAGIRAGALLLARRCLRRAARGRARSAFRITW
jgi:hypothetical protein